MGDLGVQVSVRLSVGSSICLFLNIYHGCLVSATPLTVFYRSFWNFADVFFMVWGCACGLDIIVRLFFVTFSTLWTCHFSTSVYRQWVPCERNSSYSFIPIFLKLCTCFLHVWRCAYGLDIILALIFVTFSTLWSIDELENLHADRTTVCFEPW